MSSRFCGRCRHSTKAERGLSVAVWLHADPQGGSRSLRPSLPFPKSVLVASPHSTVRVAPDIGAHESEVLLHPGLFVVRKVPDIIVVIQDDLIGVAQIETVLEAMKLRYLPSIPFLLRRKPPSDDNIRIRF